MELNWIKQNISWIFSGIGVSILGWIPFLIRKASNRGAGSHDRMNKVPANVAAALLPVGSGSSSTSIIALGRIESVSLPISKRPPSRPTPWEIRKRMQHLPLFQRIKLSEDYIGLEVSWPARLQRLVPLHSSKCEVILRFGDKRRTAKVRFVVNISHCKRLKVLLENDWVLVRGRIAGIEDEILLEDVTIEFE